MTAADIDPVIEIAASLGEAPQWPRDSYLAAANPSALPVRVALVAEEGTSKAIIGFAIANLIPPEAELETIAVAAAFQRRGLARQLFSEMAEKLQQSRVTVVSLEVRVSNVPARSFYASLGFATTGLRPHYYANPVEDAVIMSLTVG